MESASIGENESVPLRYTKSILRRNVFDPLQSKISGSPRVPYWKELERTQFFAGERLREIQWRRLKSLLCFAWEHNDFYRKRFEEARMTPVDIRSPEDFGQLNILSKEEIRNGVREMISRGFCTETLRKVKTGGSTGKALGLYITEECSELRNACARRHDRWTGWEPGEPVGALWGNPPLSQDLKVRLKNLLLAPTIYLDTMEITEKSVREFAREWLRLKPTLLFGHAHSIYLLARFVRDLSIGVIRPKAIISTSMMLLSSERRFIEEIFGVRVFDRYGCEEVSLIASECEKHEGLHMNIEHLYIEFLRDDGRYAGPGEEGKIVVTDLMNRAMPLIRYEVQDVGVPLDTECSCGRGLPLMAGVAGRVADFLIKKDGTRVAGVSLIENTLTKIRGIDQMQIIQESLDFFRISMVPGKLYGEAAGRELTAYFQRLFGPEIQVSLQLVAAIEQEKSGKYRFSICRVEQ
jgi:phenylacetate-CoA ligase